MLFRSWLDVTRAFSQEDLLEKQQGSENFDLLVLDRLLGRYDTREALPQIRALWPKAGILFLSAINTPSERAELIDLGADDYLGKPYVASELLARVRSLLRRNSERDKERRIVGRATFDLLSRRVFFGSKYEDLPAKEFVLLNMLSERPGRIVKREDLLVAVWGSSDLAGRNLVEAMVTNLRRRLENLDCGLSIRNQRNVGYWLEI
mgnify:CR=1 FL=1